MSIYSVELNYLTSIVLEVEAENEGDALQKARDIAEQAPMNNFTIVEETRSKILNVADRER